jgi:hypothetical protein
MKAHARSTDPQTSHDAAKSVRKITGTQNTILLLLGIEGMTDVDLVSAYQKMNLTSPETAPRASESGIRSRRAELVARGLVQDSGDRVKLDSGRFATVWIRA